MTITKDHIIESIHNRLGIPKTNSAELFETLLGSIKKSLENGEDVLISGFGKFSVKEKKKRRGRNPQTGEEIMLPPRRVITFQCSTVLKDKVNAKG